MRRVFSMFLVSLLCFVACKQNMYEEILFRTLEDPFYDVPKTNSLKKEKTVYLSWEEDDASDCFFLMRAMDDDNLNFTCIYQGRETNYIDTNIEEQTRYVYRLDKQRGNKKFIGETYALGYASTCREDSCENNNNETVATLLTHEFICNLPCVKYITENKIVIDEDWFYIEVPPRRNVDIIITQEGLPQNSNGSEQPSTNLMLQVVGKESISVTQNNAITIKNTALEANRFYFRVYPNTTTLLASDTFQTVIEYTISLNKIYYN